ncbi:MAG: hypothetical protein DF168_01497 [Candidatus Moanabacter tarae]|uniref:Uncharacterized protein n=1 Tax=Candidatus Moanibacter tarae TaxID=2200854 RepID=A0A2Z4ADW7_9BACT|nr:MAG: hypothetical protein DF168_01497 [Candidatus Moanabacter tarae]
MTSLPNRLKAALAIGCFEFWLHGFPPMGINLKHRKKIFILRILDFKYDGGKLLGYLAIFKRLY